MREREQILRSVMQQHEYDVAPLNRGLDLFIKDGLLVYVYYIRGLLEISRRDVAGCHKVMLDNDKDMPSQVLINVAKYKMGVLDDC